MALKDLLKLFHPTNKEHIFFLILDEDKRMLLMTYMKMKRSEEELILIKQDMESYLSYYNEKANILKSKIIAMEEQLSTSANKVKLNTSRYLKKVLIYT